MQSVAVGVECQPDLMGDPVKRLHRIERSVLLVFRDEIPPVLLPLGIWRRSLNGPA